MTTFLSGKTINLKALTEADVSIWYQWFNNPEVTRYMNKGWFPNTEDNQLSFLREISQSQNDVQLGIVSKKTDKLVGIVGLHGIRWIHRHASVSVLIGDREHWGQGLAAEAVGLVTEHAFVKLNLHKLYTGIWADNVGSLKSFEKNGYVVEGTAREKYFKDGTYHDEVILGLTCTQWQNKSGV